MANAIALSPYEKGLKKLKQLTSQLHVPETPSLVQLTVRIDVLPVLDWLKAQTEFPKLYWQNREASRQVAAIGSVDCWWLDQISPQKINWMRLTMGDATAEFRYYGGQGFQPGDPTVTALGGNRLYLPKFEIRREHSQWLLLLNLALEPERAESQMQEASVAIDKLVEPLACQPPEAKIEKSSNLPEYASWEQLINLTTQPEQLTVTPKVVLCRETRLELTQPINCWDMLNVWQAQQPGCFHFAIESQPDHAFLGCSPERLFRRDGDQLVTEAVAGTCPRSSDPEQDEALAESLLRDSKNIHEHQLVIDDIYNQLAPLAEFVEVSQTPQILTLSAVQHLKSPIQAKLVSGTGDRQLIKVLHPTAAIGGLPRQSAADYIHKHEPVKRGWYAGAFGMVGEQHSEFCVTIRSAQQRENVISLYAGVGVVAGSRPESEWHELNSKLASAMGVIYNQ